MRRIPLVCGGFLVVLGAVALIEALRMRDGWTGAQEELKKYLPPATKMGIRK